MSKVKKYLSLKSNVVSKEHLHNLKENKIYQIFRNYLSNNLNQIVSFNVRKFEMLLNYLVLRLL